jgi:hypothetical protein
MSGKPTPAGLRDHRERRKLPAGLPRRLLWPDHAGAPIEAINDPNDAIELGDEFATDAYALRVRGRSMIEDLIDDGVGDRRPSQALINGE